MTEEIPVTEARSQFSELINRVGFGKERIVLTRHGKPLVALVPAEMLDQDSPAPTVTDMTVHDLRPLLDAAHETVVIARRREVS